MKYYVCPRCHLDVMSSSHEKYCPNCRERLRKIKVKKAKDEHLSVR